MHHAARTAACLTLMLFGSVLAGCGNSNPITGPPKWEYMIEDVDDDHFSNRMNALGNEGWEAITARRADTGMGISYEIIFKRPQQGEYVPPKPEPPPAVIPPPNPASTQAPAASTPSSDHSVTMRTKAGGGPPPHF